MNRRGNGHETYGIVGQCSVKTQEEEKVKESEAERREVLLNAAAFLTDEQSVNFALLSFLIPFIEEISLN
jgi:hypothetical protein